MARKRQRQDSSTEQVELLAAPTTNRRQLRSSGSHASSSHSMRSLRSSARPPSQSPEQSTLDELPTRPSRARSVQPVKRRRTVQVKEERNGDERVAGPSTATTGALGLAGASSSTGTARRRGGRASTSGPNTRRQPLRRAEEQFLDSSDFTRSSTAASTSAGQTSTQPSEIKTAEPSYSTLIPNLRINEDEAREATPPPESQLTGGGVMSQSSIGDIGTSSQPNPSQKSLGTTQPTSQPESSSRPDPAPATEPQTPSEPLSTYNCPICFSPPTRATATPCGHVLCGECLFTAVKTMLRRNAFGVMDRSATVARCPVCRATIPGWDGKGGGVVGLRPRMIIAL